MSGTILNDGLNAGSMAATLVSTPVEPFDPVQHTMDEVDAYLDTVAPEEKLNELNRVRYLESSRSDGARPTLLDYLDNQLAIEKDRLETTYGLDPSDHNVEEVKAYVERHRDDTLEQRLLALQADETEGKGRSTLLTWIANELTFLQDAVPAEPVQGEDPAPVETQPEDEAATVADPETEAGQDVPVSDETTEGPTSDENTEPAGDGAEDDTTTEES